MVVAVDTEVAEPSHIIGIAKQTIVYGLSGVAIQAVGVITLPVYTRVFNQDGVLVAEFKRLVLVPRKNAGETSAEGSASGD